jgi:hypothetical protein
MLKSARTLALKCINDSSRDRYNYRALADVAVAFARRTNDLSFLDEAIEHMKTAENEILDPELARERRQYEQTRREIEYLSSAETN